MQVRSLVYALQMVGAKRKVDKKRMAEAEEYFWNTGKRQSGVLTYENFKAHDAPNLDN